MAKELSVKWTILIFSFIEGTVGSVGDMSPFYNTCVKNCKIDICDAGKHSVNQFNLLGLGFSLWSCLENCEYDCQWQTVQSFQRKNWSIPQFKGKWPFIRLFGFQEPASVFFSILNLLLNWKFIKLFRKKVPKSAPFFYVWNTFAMLQINSWIWSSIYHSRDNDFTEKMDYMSAFLVILFSFYCVGLRYLSTSFNKKSIIWSIFCGLIALNHLTYLWFYKFDYGYNMKLNCAVGGITLSLWILWTCLHFHTQPFVWKIFAFAVSMASFTLLELLDFPPIFWLLDAHALWHGSTLIVNTFLYLFAIDDCIYLCSFHEEKASGQKKE